MDASEGAVGRHTRTVAGLTLVSRVLGLVRDLVTVRVFGDTLVGSAFAAAFAVPNMFRRLFGEGALSAAFLPVYTRLSDDEPDRAGALATLTVAALALVTSALLLVLELALLLVIVLAPGEAGSDRVYSLGLVMLMLPFMPMICVAAVMGGMLQTHGRFAPWAAAPILMNVLVIAVSAPYFFVDGATAREWAVYIGIATLVSAALQVLWSLWALRGRVRWSRAFGCVRTEARTMFAAMLPVLVGLGTLQLNAMADTLIAMYPNWVGPTLFGRDYPLDESSNAVLFYAQRLYQFPLGVFGIAVATAAFPALARASSDGPVFARVVRRGARLSLFIGLPASIGLAVVAPDLVGLLYGHGGFSERGVDRAAWVLGAYALAVWAYSLNQLLTRAFYARGDTKTPMRIAIAMVGVNIALNLTLIWPLKETGLAVSTGVCAVAQCALLIRALGGGVLDRSVSRASGRMAVLSAASGLAAWGAIRGVAATEWGSGAGAWGDAARAGAGVLAGAGVYLGLSWGLRAPELWWIAARSTDTDHDAGDPEGSDAA